MASSSGSLAAWEEAGGVVGVCVGEMVAVAVGSGVDVWVGGGGVAVGDAVRVGRAATRRVAVG